MNLKHLAIVPAIASTMLLGACGAHTTVVDNTAVSRGVSDPTQADLRAQLHCTVASTGQENPELQEVLPDSDIKVDDLFGCVWAEHSRTLVAVQLGSAQDAQTYFGDAVHSGQDKKYEVDGRWVFIASDSHARYFAHEAFKSATN